MPRVERESHLARLIRSILIYVIIKIISLLFTTYLNQIRNERRNNPPVLPNRRVRASSDELSEGSDNEYEPVEPVPPPPPYEVINL